MGYKMEAYYYSKMNKTHQNVYHAMKTGLMTLSPSFAVPMLEGRELQNIFFQLRLDCPELFWAVDFRYRYYPHASNVEMIPEYLFNKKKVKEHQAAMESRITKLIRPAQAMTEWEKELYIHDFICTNIKYDKLKKPYSHEIIGSLGQGVSVCEGIAKTVKCLCNALGIWCIIAVSDANPDKKIKYRHAWNIVRLGGKYYHLDATFDNTLSSEGIIRYDYFNLDDKCFFIDHEPVIFEIPLCSNGEHYYYREKKLFFTKIEDVAKRAEQSARKGTPFVFQWRGGYLSRQVLSELLSLLEQAAAKKGRHISTNLNKGQAVLQVTFTEKVAMEELIALEVDPNKFFQDIYLQAE